MDKLKRLIGLQSAIAAVLIIPAVIAFIAFSGIATSSAVQDEIAAPPESKAMKQFMARKLAAAQRTLDGLARDDFELIGEMTTEMIDLSRHEAWERMASPRFVQDTVDFIAASEFLKRMAESKDSEGIALGFMRLTMTCTNCHSHVRTAMVARLDGDECR